VESFEEVVESKVNTKRMSNVLDLTFINLKIIGETSRKTNLRNKVISGQYILKDMNCFDLKRKCLNRKRCWLLSHSWVSGS